MNKNSKENKMGEERSLKSKILRSILVVTVIAVLFLLLYFILVWTGAWENINTVEKLRDLILSWGFWGRLGFISLQFLQVTFIPLPSTVTTLAGVLIYGPLQAALLSLSGIILGSVFAFFLGRVFGRKLVVFMVGEKTCEKWTKFLDNGKYTFFIMMLLPIFPDDVLCLVAGLTDMSWAFFTITNLISRPIGIFMTCYIGSGQIIPYHGWGLVAWGFIIVFVIILMILSYKYRDQIENFMKEKLTFKKLKEKKDDSQPLSVKTQEKENKQDENNKKITKKGKTERKNKEELN